MVDSVAGLLRHLRAAARLMPLACSGSLCQIATEHSVFMLVLSTFVRLAETVGLFVHSMPGEPGRVPLCGIDYPPVARETAFAEGRFSLEIQSVAGSELLTADLRTTNR